MTATQPDVQNSTADVSPSDPYAGFGGGDTGTATGTATAATSSGLSTGEKIGLVVGGIALVGVLVLYAKYRAVTAPIRHAHRVVKAGQGFLASLKG